MELDSRIQQAKKNNAFSFAVVGIGIGIVLVLGILWVFLIKGYQLVITPSEAVSDHSIEVVDGVAFHSGNRIYLVGDKADIKVSAPTFESVMVKIIPQSSSNIEVVMPPKPGRILASVPEQQTSWFINNNLVYVGSDLDYSLAQGEHQLRIDNPFYKVHEQSFTLARAEQKKLDIQLQSFEGQVVLTTNAQNAKINLSEQELSLPLEQALRGGSYPVTITAPGYQSIEDTIEITWQQPRQTRSYTMVPEQAQLSFNLAPTGGYLEVNGVALQTSSIAVDSNRPVDIRYSKTGYFDYQSSVTLSPAEQRSVDIALKPARARVKVISNISADVFVDGRQVASTPATLDVTAADHVIELRKQGYRTIKRTISAKANKTLTLDETMLTEYAARRAEGKPTHAQKLGIQMLGFRGEAFTMGSPVNQPGRRRNEFPVPVELQKPFYVAAHEITQAQFAAFLGQASTSQLPQANITWLQAAEFCNWLSRQDGLPEFYRITNNRLVSSNPSSTGYRLPTEAEWEWLAKKASRRVATTYVWGNADTPPKDAGNFADKSRQGQQAIVLSEYDDEQAGPAAVGSYRVDRVGLYDLAGNLSEWVHDKYSSTIPDTNKTYIDYLGPARGELNVIKGGNFTVGKTRDLRAAYREPAAEAKPTLGFRIARYAQ